MSGRLCVCATPIGNLGDVTLRVLEALREADVIAAEDTRHARRLTGRYDIATPLVSYHAHNLDTRTGELVARIEAGESVALVSDAGTPGVSDPGARLVEACLAAGLAVEVLPGPSAIITALVASGLPTHAFYFGGFLPRKRGDIEKRLAEVALLDATLVFYESPNRVAATLWEIAERFPARHCVVARELTKVHEEVVRGTAHSLAAEFAGRERVRGEVVVLLGPPEPDEAPDIGEDEIARRLGVEIASGATVRDAVKAVSKQTAVPRNAVYEVALRMRPAERNAKD